MKIKYFLKNIIEKFPAIINFFLKNLNFFSFLLPQEKDFNALNLIFKKKNEPGDIIDVGANYGQSSLSFRKIGFKNKIYLFEPNYNLIKFLKKNEEKNFKIFNFGLGNKNCKVFLYKASLNGVAIDPISSTNLKLLKLQIEKQFPNQKKNIKINREIIKIKCFDSLKLNLRPLFIKIDVEGYEYFVVKGMINNIKKFLPVLIIEYNLENFSKLYKLLSKYYYPYLYLLDQNKLKRFKKNKIQKYLKGDFYSYKKPRNVIFIKKVLSKKIY